MANANKYRYKSMTYERLGGLHFGSDWSRFAQKQTSSETIAMTRNVAESRDDNDVLIWGAANIGRELNRNARQTFHLLESGVVPGAEKVGNQWVVRRRNLLKIGAALLKV
jgi:hypothetical protein